MILQKSSYLLTVKYKKLSFVFAMVETFQHINTPYYD